MRHAVFFIIGEGQNYFPGLLDLQDYCLWLSSFSEFENPHWTDGWSFEMYIWIFGNGAAKVWRIAWRIDLSFSRNITRNCPQLRRCHYRWAEGGNTITNGDCQKTKRINIKHMVFCHKIQFNPAGLDSVSPSHSFMILTVRVVSSHDLMHLGLIKLREELQSKQNKSKSLIRDVTSGGQKSCKNRIVFSDFFLDLTS